MSRAATRLASLATSGLVAATVALPLGMLTAGPASAATTPAPKACPTAGCTIVSRADIDGDGRRDTTSLTRLGKGTAYTLRVVTARGAVASTKVATPWLFGLTPFNGAVKLDGVRGAELVIRVGSGAHTQYSHVYTWRKGALVTEKDPSGATEWVTDGAMSFASGYTLRTVKGTKQLTSISLARDTWQKPATFSGTRIVATWKNGRWTPINHRSVKVVESPRLWDGAGWNIGGLTRW